MGTLTIHYASQNDEPPTNDETKKLYDPVNGCVRKDPYTQPTELGTQPKGPIVFSTDPTLPDPFQHWHGDFNPNPQETEVPNQSTNTPQPKVKSTKTETRVGNIEYRVTTMYSTESFANRQSSIIALSIAKAVFFISILPALGLLIQTCLVMPESPISSEMHVLTMFFVCLSLSSAYTISQYKRKLN